MNDAVAGRGSACDDPLDTADPGTRSYLRDYAAMLYATPFPSLVVNHRWDVIVANSAYDALFGSVRPHPTAMPRHNFLRFVLFHPDASEVLAEHETSWCLPLLAQFASALDTHAQDRGIQDIRRDIAADPIMNAAYQQGLPHWIRAVGRAAVEHDGALRPLRHPDPAKGRATCRIISETPATLRSIGLSRLTLMLQDPGLTATATAPPSTAARTRRGASHLRVV